MNQRTLAWLSQKMGVNPQLFIDSRVYANWIDENGFYPFMGGGYQRKRIKVNRAGRIKRKIIHIPNKKLKKLQRLLLKKVLKPFVYQLYHHEKINFFKFSHGGLYKKSIITHLQPHLENRYFFVTDIYRAYDNTNTYMLTKALRALGFYNDVVRTILDLTTLDEKLIIGTPTSPLLFNLVMSWIDNRVYNLLKDYEFEQSQLFDIQYTRYFDDLVFSSQLEIPNKLQQSIIKILNDFGYEIHKNKTFYKDVTKQPLEVVGITITSDGLKLSKRKRRNLEAILKMAQYQPDKLESLVNGKLGHFLQVYDYGNLPKKIMYLLQDLDLVKADQTSQLINQPNL